MNILAIRTSVLALTAMLILSMVPVANGRTADAWQSIGTSASADTLDYDLTRLNIAGNSSIQRIGDNTMVWSDEQPFNDGLVTVTLINGNSMSRIENVPVTALDAKTVLKNNNRVVWTVKTNSSARYDVYEIDFVEGKAVRRFDDLFLGSSSNVNVFASANQTFYFEIQSPKLLVNGFPAVKIVSASAGSKNIQEINMIYRNAFETIEDFTDDGRVVTRVLFENGDQELWYHEAGESRAIPDSYTIDGYILGTQFSGNDVEFFRYQQLMKYDPTMWSTVQLEDKVLWNADVISQQDLLYANDGVLFFVMYNEVDQRHYVMRRKSGLTQQLGSWGGGTLDIKNGIIQFSRSDMFANGLSQYDARTGLELTHQGGIAQVDSKDRSLIAIDIAGQANFERDGKTLSIGTATEALLKDATHALITRNSRVYLVTIKPHFLYKHNMPLFGKFTNSSTVFMLRDGKRWTVVNEATYYSWKSDFSGLITLDASNENLYRDAGIAPFAPGTMIKSPTSSTVYYVTSGRVIEPIMTEADAYSLFGSEWWKEVNTVEQSIMDLYTDEIIVN
jgi:hypothetical protein